MLQARHSGLHASLETVSRGMAKSNIFGHERRRTVHGNMSTPHSDILLRSNLSIVVCPALAGVVEKAHPEKIKLGAIINHRVRVAFALRRNDRDRRVELQY